MGNDLNSYRITIGSHYPAHSKGIPSRIRVKQYTGLTANISLLICAWSICMSICLLNHLSPHDKLKRHQLIYRILLYILVTWSIASTLLSLSGDVHTNPGPQPMTNTTLKCIVLNAQSIKAIDTIDNKILDLQNIVYSTLPHVISICETWLIPEILLRLMIM